MVQRILPVTTCYVGTQDAKKGFAFAKRAFDIVVSLVMIVALLPLLLVLAAISAVDTKGCPLFAQTRMGRNNQPFKMLKFRTMNVNAPANVATHKLRDAARYISPVGEVLRKFSLDELPQLFNILKGDMSFVGPRPVVLSEKDLISLRVRNGACTVRPGLTGWSQIHGRDRLPIRQKAELDGYYAQNQSMELEFSILLKTVSYVLHSTGVHEGADPSISASPAMQREERSA